MRQRSLNGFVWKGDGKMLAERTKWYVATELLSLAGLLIASMMFDAGIIGFAAILWAIVGFLAVGLMAVYLINLEYKRACSRERHERRVVKSTEYVRKCYERYEKENA